MLLFVYFREGETPRSKACLIAVKGGKTPLPDKSPCRENKAYIAYLGLQLLPENFSQHAIDADGPVRQRHPEGALELAGIEA